MAATAYSLNTVKLNPYWSEFKIATPTSHSGQLSRSQVQFLPYSPDDKQKKLLLCRLAVLSRQHRWITLIAPHFVPSKQSLERWGIDPNKVLVVDAVNTNNVEKVFVSACQSGNNSAVLAWLDKRSSYDAEELEQAASDGDCRGFVFAAPSFQ
ncbi:SulA-like leucine-rich domain-containing protein [Aliagarivorans marinus]|uniref:SulA-like leucine-rich domain-containing protein n=1 Tax=Aliagarivorans marinus TaxID=561965 RepID=UPI0004214816|nr:SulA-like leucine-rich domain-containing protein [Aliagarivorans marinus]